jgi:hypothetical protein
MNLHRLLAIACSYREDRCRNVCGVEARTWNEVKYDIRVPPGSYYLIPGGAWSGYIEANYADGYVDGLDQAEELGMPRSIYTRAYVEIQRVWDDEC